MEHLLALAWMRWQMRGARPAAQPLVFHEGWRLALCFRAKVSAWMIFLLFFGLLIGVVAMQVAAPQPQRVFQVEAVAFSAFSLMGVYYLAYVYAYRVELDRHELVLRRFLIPNRHIAWEEIIALDYEPSNDTLKLRARDGRAVGLYLTLHGLSALRRCVAAFAPQLATQSSFAATDQALMENVPAWRCSEQDLRGNPFALLVAHGVYS